jgi:1-deoxy-D-xylulose-5-phosphate reductoisomerase
MTSRILLLGSTGSIGRSTLNCVRRLPDHFSIAGLAAGSNIDLLIGQIREFNPEAVSIAAPAAAERLATLFPRLAIFSGPSGLEALIGNVDFDIMLNALVGAVGLRPTVAGLRRNKRVALANKESLVIGGDLLRPLLEAGHGSILPVDSEHSAILQCLAGAADTAVESIILTASGGPFRDLPREQFAGITTEEALNHPTWSMGKKITIDAATLMNKGFEVIEAHHLFSVSYDRLRVWIHPQSIVHSLVELYDGAVMAQLGLPDMELPIQYALSYPDRLPINGRRLSLPEIGSLEFFEPDLDRFPCLRLCIEAGRQGGVAPAVINAANEVAVEAFLSGRIPFPAIADAVGSAFEKHRPMAADSLEAIEETDRLTREMVCREHINTR